MSPRPRKASDEDVFAATLQVMQRLGPTQLTLADIAERAGLTPGALVQRFGSKRALLLALSERFAGSTAAMFAELRATAPSPIATLYAYGDCMAGMGVSADALAHHLSWLQQDLIDPDFRRYTLIQARASRAELQRLVGDAITEGALKKSVDAVALARAIEITVGGSLMAWGIHQEGTAKAWVRQDLDALLRPYMTPKTERRIAKPPKTRKGQTRVSDPPKTAPPPTSARRERTHR
jgi:AcrR family transcriptional regulator